MNVGHSCCPGITPRNFLGQSLGNDFRLKVNDPTQQGIPGVILVVGFILMLIHVSNGVFSGRGMSD